MFIDEKAEGEAKTAEVANRKLKLSEAIRIGSVGMEQGPQYFGPNKNNCCAWGAAGIAIGTRDIYEISRYFGVPHRIDIEVHGMNACRGRGTEFSFNGIADWLESKGY